MSDAKDFILSTEPEFSWCDIAYAWGKACGDCANEAHIIYEPEALARFAKALKNIEFANLVKGVSADVEMRTADTL